MRFTSFYLFLNALILRQAAGGVPANIPDEDLDRYIADTILKEAAAANKRYQEIGIGAFVKNK